jgi:RimJ/RimL family protein N-acetyltransferase
VNISIFPARPEHYDWLIAGTTLTGPDGIWLAEPELEPPALLLLLKNAAESVNAVLGTSSWLILNGTELVGLCDVKREPDEHGVVEIGYGIAANRRGRGIASRAISLMLAEISRMPQVSGIVAETAISNHGSQKVLERNGFVQVGSRRDNEDGDLIIWRWMPGDVAPKFYPA